MVNVSLDRIAGSDEAIFAIDRSERIIVWNQACEYLLGHRSVDMLGRFCHHVIGGRDLHGNIHCYANCPVVHQIRRVPDEPIHRFPMRVRTASGATKPVSVSAFLLESEDPRFGVIAHVLKDSDETFSSLERALRRMSEASSAEPAVIERITRGLTAREEEILRCLARGMSTGFIADHLCIARVTVRNHVRNVLQKLGVHTKFAAVAYAYQNDIV